MLPGVIVRLPALRRWLNRPPGRALALLAALAVALMPMKRLDVHAHPVGEHVHSHDHPHAHAHATDLGTGHHDHDHPPITADTPPLDAPAAMVHVHDAGTPGTLTAVDPELPARTIPFTVIRGPPVPALRSARPAPPVRPPIA
ncbi:MAG TPA: hypothetical protein PKZ76_15280 [Xanthomonadaceae bacterium]|nr:hypothetical protein [Xanthomonadaceae bacterium]